MVEARIEPGRPLVVSMDYFLRPGGARSVSFTALELDGARAANVRAFAGERELSFRASSESGPRLDGRVDLPATVSDAERLRLRLTYEVLPRPQPIEERTTLVLPMLVAEWPPAETLPRTFVATVRLPRELRVLDSFPSEYERIASYDRNRSADAVRFSLAVVPALLRLRLGGAGVFGWTPARALDLGAMVALVAIAFYGWRRLREHLV